jgi:CRISPR/Cas system CMR-associated protein Cmr5 small subunit
MSKKAVPPTTIFDKILNDRSTTKKYLYPETVILSITTHGEIPVELKTINDKDGKITEINAPITYEIPESIREFYKFNAVAPGIINYVAGDNPIDVSEVEKMNNKLKRRYREYVPQFTEMIEGDEVSTMNFMIRNNMSRHDIEGKSIKEIAETLLPKIQKSISERLNKQEESLKESIKELKQIKKNQDKDAIEVLSSEIADIQNYIHSFSRGDQLVNCITPSRIMINKQYSLEKHNTSMNEDWSITCLNMPRNHGSLYTKIVEWKKGASRGEHRQPVRLSDIVNYLAEHGVTRLFIVDLTCAPFSNDDSYLEYNADGRRMRNNIIGTSSKIPYGGKNKKDKTKRRKNKTNKTRKNYHNKQ